MRSERKSEGQGRPLRPHPAEAKRGGGHCGHRARERDPHHGVKDATVLAQEQLSGAGLLGERGKARQGSSRRAATPGRPCDGGKSAPSLKKSEDGEVEEFSRASGPTEESQVMVISNKLLTPFGGLIQRSIGLMVSLGR